MPDKTKTSGVLPDVPLVSWRAIDSQRERRDAPMQIRITYCTE
jgi:hypothetical protein